MTLSYARQRESRFSVDRLFSGLALLSGLLVAPQIANAQSITTYEPPPAPLGYYYTTSLFGPNLVSTDGSAAIFLLLTSGVAGDSIRVTSAGVVDNLGHLPGLPGTYTRAISGDGNVVVGQSSNGSLDRAFRWTTATGLVDLGSPGIGATADGVNWDGSVIVGYWYYGPTQSASAMLWTPALGAVDLRTYLSTLGISLPNYDYWEEALAVSPDGLTISGMSFDHSGKLRAWRVTLPPLAFSDLGSGLAGAGGVPHLSGSGTLAAGSANQLDLSSAKPSSTATLVFGLSSINAPFKGGVLVPSPLLTMPLPTNPAGATSLPFVFPAGVPAGTPIFFQFWIQDAAASHGFSASNGLKGVTS